MRASSLDALERSFAVALECLDEERRRTTAELRALETFVDEARVLPTESVSYDTGPATAIRTARGQGGVGGTGAVRDAYEATLMGVPHYDEEYDDTYFESVAEEFGPDLASALVERDALDDQLKSAVLSAATQAQAPRDALLKALDTETESLDAARQRLDSIVEELTRYTASSLSDRNFGTLDAYRARLTVLENRCDDLAANRQTTLREQRHRLLMPVEGPDIPTYAYQSLDVDYPVIAAVTAVAERIAATRDEVERAMGYCN